MQLQPSVNTHRKTVCMSFPQRSRTGLWHTSEAWRVMKHVSNHFDSHYQASKEKEKHTELQTSMYTFPFYDRSDISFKPQCWLEMLFIGSNPSDGEGAMFMLRTVWEWYGLRENITSPWAGECLSASNPCSSPQGPLAKKVPRAFHLQCHVDYTAGWAERRLAITFAPSWWLSFTFQLPLFFF